ncbi:uncharacterized protein LOC111682937 [Lucilia cuprina]|uniref:uncharacterized protein LOC111682937 n=1 Tax=Lucilia cuprina TaxID=7375 RepID=UPI001F06858E|nr:uncharacterized protein LOC111682937 [Lucilia cuprina]
MHRNNYIIKVPVMAIIVALVLTQLQLIVMVLGAKHYNQPYGDILMKDNENEYQNIFDTRNGLNRIEPRNRQRLGNSYQQPAVGYGGKYQNEYETPATGRRRGEREKSQYQNMDNTYYNRNNRNLGRNNPNGWMVSSSIVEEQQQHDNVTMENREDSLQHKCHIWVPMDALDKYPNAERKQDNKITGSVYIEICCKGYAPMRWRGRTLCRPICDNCQNGRCIAPGVCECYDEYVANDNGDCVFTCPMGCLNGHCYLDGTCQCDPGYKLDESRKFCRPICSKGCGNSRLHNCTEPEVCGCNKGYILTDNDCQPVCQPECGNGGTCQSPNNCLCAPGFDKKDGVCQADCYQKCDNGICYSRNRCICNPGFTYHERSTQCIPK